MQKASATIVLPFAVVLVSVIDLFSGVGHTRRARSVIPMTNEERAT